MLGDRSISNHPFHTKVNSLAKLVTLNFAPQINTYLNLAYLSMLADHPNFPETSTQGEELIRLEIWTFATLSPRFLFIQSHSSLYSFSISFPFSSSSAPPDIVEA